ncbi:hypothetical protein ACFDTO_33660 [Microbacteriaceae bacterium 4G12]
MKKKMFFIFGSSVLLLLTAWVYCIIKNGTPAEFSKEKWPKTEETAKLATIECFKKERNLDVTIDQVSFSGEYATHEIYLEGHVVGNERQKISVTVNSAKNYQVKITSKN